MEDYKEMYRIRMQTLKYLPICLFLGSVHIQEIHVGHRGINIVINTEALGNACDV